MINGEQEEIIEKILSYSVFRFSPILLHGEAINLGILYSDEYSCFHTFKGTTNFARLKAFDNKIEIDSIKTLLNDIEQDVQGEWYKDQFDIESYVKFYINDYKFDAVSKIEYEDLEQMIEYLYKKYIEIDKEEI